MYLENSNYKKRLNKNGKIPPCLVSFLKTFLAYIIYIHIYSKKNSSIMDPTIHFPAPSPTLSPHSKLRRVLHISTGTSTSFFFFFLWSFKLNVFIYLFIYLFSGSVDVVVSFKFYFIFKLYIIVLVYLLLFKGP